MLHDRCRSHMLSVSCRMLHVATWRARSEASRFARARARNVHSRALFVRMAVADEAVGRKASVALRAHSALATAATAHTVFTAAAPHPSLQSGVGLQLAQIAVNCNAAEKALLADLTEAHPDALYVELLRLFKARRSVADGHSWRACCIVPAVCFAVPAQICSQLPHLTLCSVLRCLFFVVGCLFVCLFVCLFFVCVC